MGVLVLAEMSTKKEIVKQLMTALNEAGVPLNQKQTVVVADSVFGMVRQEVARTGSFSYPGLGKFHTRKSPERTRDLSHLGKGLGVVTTPPKTHISFSTATAWERELNPGLNKE